MHVTGLKPSPPGWRALFIEDIFGDTVSLGALDGAVQEVPQPASSFPLGGYVIEGGEVRAFDMNMRRLSTSLVAERAHAPVTVAAAPVFEYCRPCAKDR